MSLDTQNRETYILATNWKFILDNQKEAWKKRFDDSKWETVCIPHDWSVKNDFNIKNPSGTGYVIAGTGFYRKSFLLPETAQNKTITITFDGVYNNSMVWINGYYLGKHPYGYTEFTYDISDFCFYGNEDNVVSVKVEHKDNGDSRWFTGSGIYRKVSVTVKDKLSIDKNGVFANTVESNKDQAKIEVSTKVLNKYNINKSISVTNLLIDKDNKTIAESTVNKTISNNSGDEINCLLEINNPNLWDVSNPYMYKLITNIYDENGKLIDSEQTPIGIRNFHFDSQSGFYLNGVNLKLKGVCVHHDAGCLGAAVRAKVWLRRLKTLKEIGCNSIRMSHNPHMPELYDLCDQLGFLVIDEAFDEWEGVKNKWHQGHNVYPPNHVGYFEDFIQWHKADLSSMILRDRNHPSIILWSIGNEIDYPNDPYCHPSFKTMTGNNDKDKPDSEKVYDPTRPNSERLVTIAKELVEIVKTIDISRPVTAALAFPELSTFTGLSECLDVVGYNYKEHLYTEDHKRFPNKPLLGSENGKELSHWLAVTENDFISGQYLWTGIDFLGETQGWPCKGSQAGIMDLAGFEKPAAYFRKSLWSEVPFVKLFTTYSLTSGKYSNSLSSDWNYQTKQRVKVFCFTNCEVVEFSINDKPICKKHMKDFSKEHIITFEVEFESGQLSASSVSKGITVKDTMNTVSSPVEIKLIPSEVTIKADGMDMTQIEVNLVDINGNLTYNSNELINVSVTGTGFIMGIENGDLFDTSPYTNSFKTVKNGKAIIYLSSTLEKGQCLIEVSSTRINSTKLVIECV